MAVGQRVRQRINSGATGLLRFLRFQMLSSPHTIMAVRLGSAAVILLGLYTLPGRADQLSQPPAASDMVEKSQQKKEVPQVVINGGGQTDMDNRRQSTVSKRVIGCEEPASGLYDAKLLGQKRQLDPYALWKFSISPQLRLSAKNLVNSDYQTGTLSTPWYPETSDVTALGIEKLNDHEGLPLTRYYPIFLTV